MTAGSAPRRKPPLVTPTERLRKRVEELEAELHAERMDSFRFSVLCAFNATPAPYRDALLRRAIEHNGDRHFVELCARQIDLSHEALAEHGATVEDAANFVCMHNTIYYARGLRELAGLESTPPTVLKNDGQ